MFGQNVSFYKKIVYKNSKCLAKEQCHNQTLYVIARGLYLQSPDWRVFMAFQFGWWYSMCASRQL